MATVSIVMIVKDEAANLPACLEQAKTVGDELVIVDTGSTDNTLEIANAYTDKVFHFNWIDDFAAARNASIDAATGDWCLVLDADEVIVDPVAAKLQLQTFIQQHNNLTLGTVERFSDTARADGGVVREQLSRLFKRHLFRYQGTIHEQLVSVGGGEVSRQATGVQITHSGYVHSSDDAAHKANRNIPLLQQAVQQNPGDEYYLYQLGQAYFSRQTYPQAIEAFEAAEQAIDFSAQTPLGIKGAVSREVLTHLITSLCYAYINTQAYDKAEALLLRHRRYAHAGTQRADFAHALGYVYFMLGKAPQAIDAYQLSLHYGTEQEDVLGTGSFASYYHLGLLYEASGDPIKALEHYASAVQQKPDYRQALARCIGFIVDYKTTLPEDLFRLSAAEHWQPVLLQQLQQCQEKADEEGIALLTQTAQVLSVEIYKDFLTRL